MDIEPLVFVATIVLPLIVDLVARIFKLEEKNVKRTLAIALSVILAVAPEISFPITDAGELLARLVGKFSLILVLSQTIYARFYKDGEVQNKVAGK